MTAHPPVRTWRAIGVVPVAGGRAVDLALIETDGAAHLRQIETIREPIDPAAASLATIVRGFMGDRSLQPFAVDVIALAAGADAMAIAAIMTATDVRVLVVAPARGRSRAGFAAAERVAFAGVVAAQRDAGHH
jgi:hypothetical protein